MLNDRLAEQYANKGEAQFHKENNIEGALISYSKAIELSGGRTQYYFYRAIVYAHNNQFIAAVADLDMVIADQDTWTGKGLSNAYAHRGLYRLYADGEEKRETYERMAKVIGDSEEYSKFLEKQSERTKLLQAKALNDLNRAIQIDPQNDLAYIWRAEVHWDRGDKSKASKDYRKAHQLNAENINYRGFNQKQQNLYQILKTLKGY